MGLVRFDQGPKITDTVLIQFQVTDDAGAPFNPYLVQSVIIYYLERGVATTQGSHEFLDGNLDIHYSTAVPVKVFGGQTPAWLSTDIANAEINKVTYDDQGNELFGVFAAEWTPDFNREGDYYACWTWQPIIAGVTLSNYLSFFLASDTTVTTSSPAQATVPGKYETLMDRYLPEMYKNYISNSDVTPDVINRFNQGIAQGFTELEDRANQILALQDANALSEALMPYLANYFNWKLKTNDPTLWRRQVKRAIPLYKKKGTLDGLTEAFNQAGITLNSLTRFWQVASKSTFTEGFRVVADNQDVFQLANIPLPVDPLNFSLQLLPAGTTTYVTLSSSDVSFTSDDGIGYMNWIGSFQLSKDDLLVVKYLISPVVDQTVEDYIQSLPLMDNRSEIVMRDLNICYPIKNWNIRLIAETDAMLPVICPTREPYHDPIIFGQIRTEFPYSEAIYNMEEYNGGLWPSFNPCDIDRNFADPCPCCLSSNISLDVSLTDLSNDRMDECLDVLREFLPFHAALHSINFNGDVDEYILPPVEEISTYMTNQFNDNLIQGQMVVNRTIQPWTANLKRNMLATAQTMVTDTTGEGFNLGVTLYYPAEAFDQETMGFSLTNNQLQILSGANTGTYSVTNPNGNYIDFVNPSTVPSPFDVSQFPFRLSNLLFSGPGDIYQDDLFVFSDVNANFSPFNMTLAKNITPHWMIRITSGPYTGLYDIYDILPDDSLVILNWPGVTNVTNLQYDLVSDGSATILSGTTGVVSVTRRGRFETSSNLIDQYLIQPGYYLEYSGTQYKITSFINQSKCYLSGYTGGTVIGIPTVNIYKRVIDNGVGYVAVRGTMISTSQDYYTLLQVSNQLEDNQHIENFMVLIGTNYYQIASWSNTPDGGGRYDIVLNGLPVPEWGVTGVPNITFSILQFLKTSPVDVVTTYPVLTTTTIDRVDRRGNDVITNDVQTLVGPMNAAMFTTMVNAANSGQPVEIMSQTENITITIDYKE